MKRYTRCPVCGAPFARRSPDVLVCGECNFHLWLGSKPAVGAVLLRTIEGRKCVLLARRAIDPYRGMWDLPGGFLGNGERPEDGLVREIREELGVAATAPKLLATDIAEYPRDDIAEEARFVLTLFYECEIPDGAVLLPADDVAEAVWFPLDALPDDIAFDCNKRILASLRQPRTPLR
jgi:ADP-ribose pyrophosphatase YjhB (NUDIX family)